MNKSTKPNRRAFLEQSVALASTAFAVPLIVPASALGQDGQTAPSERVTVGSIGVGSMGRGDMKGLMKAEGVQVLATCDVFEDRRQQAKTTLPRGWQSGKLVRKTKVLFIRRRPMEGSVTSRKTKSSTQPPVADVGPASGV